MRLRYFSLQMAFCIGMSISPLILLMHGLAQFKILTLVDSVFSEASFGYSVALVSLSMIVLGPLSGRISDRLYRKIEDRRISVILGSLIGALGLVIFAHSSGLLIARTSWIIASFGYSLSSVSCFALTASRVEVKKQGKTYGLIGIAIPLCSVCVGIISLGLLSGESLDKKIYSIIFFQILSVILLFYRYRNDESFAAKNLTEGKSFLQIREVVVRLVRNKDFRLLFLSGLFMNTAISGLKMMPLFYMVRLCLNEKQVYELNSIMFAGTVFLFFSSFITGRIVDKFGHVLMLNVIGGGILVACMVFYSMAESMVLVIVVSCFFSFGLGVSGPARNILINMVLLDKKSYASDISILHASNNIGSFLTGVFAPVIILYGKVWGGGDGYDVYFILLSLLLLVSILFLWKIQRYSFN